MILVATGPAMATTKVGTSAAQFLKVGVGCRAAALGGAYVAIADDAAALFWNPAGLSRLDHNELLLMHADWLADTNYNFGGVVMTFGGNALGIYLTALNYGEWEVTTVDEPDGTGEIMDASDIALGASYARSLTDRFSFGFSVKYIRQDIWHMNAQGFAFDVGTLYVTRFNNMRIGMSMANFGNKMEMGGKDARVFHDVDPGLSGHNESITAYLETDQWDLPLNFRVGLAMDVLPGDPLRWTVAVDALHPNDNNEAVNFGSEVMLNDLVAIRGGYKAIGREDSEEGLTFGGGIQYPLTMGTAVKIDYAYSDWGRLEYVHRFSMGLEF
jgi:long-subunit fatty acid transport protein